MVIVSRGVALPGANEVTRTLAGRVRRGMEARRRHCEPSVRRTHEEGATTVVVLARTAVAEGATAPAVRDGAFAPMVVQVAAAAAAAAVRAAACLLFRQRAISVE